jgi:glutamate/aspartate transport system substrate-binding protein
MLPYQRSQQGNFMKKQFLALAVLTAMGTGAYAQATDTIAKVKASGEITMGVRDSSGALSYTLGDGKYAGYHVEICQHIIANLEKVVGKKVAVKYLSVTSQNRIPLVQNGTVDIECGSTTNNATRQKDVAFALTTFVEEVRMAVKANSGITSITQLNGKSVATTTGTTSVQMLRKNQRANGIDFKEVFGKDHAESFLLLESGRADAFVMDGSILAGNIANAKNPADFKIVGEVLSVEPIAIMMRKGDPAFKKLADDTIREMAKSGEITKLYDKWFMQAIPPKNTKVGLAASDSIKAAWATPNDKPMEDYAKK